MSPKIDAKKILKKLDTERGDRKKVSLYLSEHLYEEFKKRCEPHGASLVMEELMRQFIDSSKTS